jgi:hypothetical protein
MSAASQGRITAFVRRMFPWGTWGQRARTVMLGVALLAIAGLLGLLGLIAYGRLSIAFFKPEHRLSLSGKTQTQCIGRYLVDVPVEFGAINANSVELIYGLTMHDKSKMVELEIKSDDYDRTRFEEDVQASLDRIKKRRTDWGTSALLAQKVIDTPFGKAWLLRHLDRTSHSIYAGMDSELHLLVGNRYVLLRGATHELPNPKPKATKGKPLYTYMDPMPTEDRLRKAAMGIKRYTDATRAPEGFCADGLVLNSKTMGYDFESAGFRSNEDNQVLPDTFLDISINGQYDPLADHDRFNDMLSVHPVIRAILAVAGSHYMELRSGTSTIAGMPAREYVLAVKENGIVSYQLMAQATLAEDQQNVHRQAFTITFGAGDDPHEKVSPLDQDQVLNIWDAVFKSMRLSPANGGNNVDPQTGGLLRDAKAD